MKSWNWWKIHAQVNDTKHRKFDDTQSQQTVLSISLASVFWLKAILRVITSPPVDIRKVNDVSIRERAENFPIQIPSIVNNATN